LIAANQNWQNAINNWKLKFLLRPGAGRKLFGSITNIDFRQMLWISRTVLWIRKIYFYQEGTIKRTGPYNAQDKYWHRDVVVDFPF